MVKKMIRNRLFFPTSKGSAFCSKTFSFFSKICTSLLLIAALSTSAVFAQNETQITGTVTDAVDGSVLPGVNITVQGMPSVGTTTNIDGEYSLNVPADQNVILFSFIGFRLVRWWACEL